MRKWFDENKIWFETVTAVLLSIASIIVSVNSVIEMKRQTRIIELEMLPKFTISAHLEKSGRNGDIYDDENVYVTNNGGYFREFKIEYVTVLNINNFSFSTLKEKNKDIILINYYSGTAYNAGSIIAPVSIKGYENNLKFNNLLNEYRQRLSEEDIYGKLWINRYVKITYQDFLEKKHTEYYKVELIYGSSLINKVIGEKVFKRKENTIDIVSLDSLNFDLLYSIISE